MPCSQALLHGVSSSLGNIVLQTQINNTSFSQKNLFLNNNYEILECIFFAFNSFHFLSGRILYYVECNIIFEICFKEYKIVFRVINVDDSHQRVWSARNIAIMNQQKQSWLSTTTTMYYIIKAEWWKCH